MQWISHRLHRLLHHWATAPFLLALIAVVTIQLDRFPHWDESVFMTQTAGRDGLDAPAATLGPTREIGSVWKLAVLTGMSANLPNLRLLHILLSIVVIAVVAASLAHTTRLPVTAVGMTLGTYWVTFAYLGQLLRFVLVAFVLIGALSLFARMLNEDRLDTRRVVPLAGLFVVGLVLGPLETGLVLVATTAYWLVRRPIWRHPWPPLVFALCIVVASLPVLWLDTVRRYGSIGGRLRAISEMTGPTSTSAFNGELVDDYLAQVLDGPVSNAFWAAEGALAGLAYPVAALLMLAASVAIGRWVVNVARRRKVDDFVGVASLSVVVLMVFLAGYYSDQADRYFILPGSLLLVLGMMGVRDIWRRVIAARASGAGPAALLQPVVVVLGLLVFVVSNVAAADGLDANWAANGEPDGATFALLEEVADGEPCAGVARYNIPSVQWATGCTVRSAASLQDAMTLTDAVGEDVGLVFVYWTTAEVDAATKQRLTDGGWTPLIDDGPGSVVSHQVWFRH